MAKHAGRSLGALLLGSLAVVGGASSCANGDTVEPGGSGSTGGVGVAGKANGGSSAVAASAGMSHGGQVGAGGTGSTGGTTGGSLGLGGAGGSTATAGTGAAGAGGSLSAGGAFSAGGAASGGASTGGSGGAAMGGRGGQAAGGSAGKSASGGMSAGGAGSGSGGYGANGGVAPPPDINGGSQAWASRYWDCCKPACGWTGNTGGRQPVKACSDQNQTLGDNNAKNACENGGSAYMCWQGAPWAVGDKLAYGFVAASGSNYNCGRCFHVQFDGSSHNGGGSAASGLAGKHMIVQVINNGGVQNDQFDLLIPGGGIGIMNGQNGTRNACAAQWGSGADLGPDYGGFMADCGGDKNCVQQRCASVFSGKQDLLDGCSWFLGWFTAADNPTLKYEKVACPAAITQVSGLSDPG